MLATGSLYDEADRPLFKVHADGGFIMMGWGRFVDSEECQLGGQ